MISICPARQAVYPRSRREHLVNLLSRIQPAGLSPLAPGTPSLAFPNYTTARFIPARAGNTARRAITINLTPVYPRSRGEHSPGSASSPNASGLSPLARGTLARFPAWPHVYRFIPAHAGNSAQTGALCVDAAVYPGSRGELLLKHNRILPFRGLSPLTWGTHNSSRLYALHKRFIPAHAGNTAYRRQRMVLFPVYPRSRGEHYRTDKITPSGGGLSPLTRGTRALCAYLLPDRRFIHAHAGNTRYRL